MTSPSVRDQVDDCLARLAAGGSPHVFTRLYPEAARAAADAADARRALGISLGPLDGAIVSIKDLFDVAGEPTTAGSKILGGASPANADALVIRRLRRAGAVILGKTNMSEFAFTGVGLNPHHGTPGNATDPRLIPGGSSSGAGVSAADGTSDIAIGTDTGGSVRIPAALNGVVGFKPTAGRVPLGGTFPLSPTLDSIGPLARSVAECAAADAVMAGEEPEPPRALPLALAQLAVPRGRLLSGLEPAVSQAFESALSRLSDAGASLFDLEIEDLLDVLESVTRTASIPSIEAAGIHTQRLAESAALFDPNVLARIRRGAAIPASVYIEMVRTRQDLVVTMDGRLRPFDAMVLPTSPVAAVPIDSMLADLDAFTVTNLLLLRNPSVANLFDLCSISLPLPDTGPPVGLMLFGRRGHDRDLLDLAASVEELLAPALT